MTDKRRRRPAVTEPAPITTEARSRTSLPASPWERIERAEQHLTDAGGRVRLVGCIATYGCVTPGCRVTALDRAAAMYHAADAGHLVESRWTSVEHFGDAFASERIITARGAR